MIVKNFTSGDNGEIIADTLARGGMLALTMDDATDDDLTALAYDTAVGIATGTPIEMLGLQTHRTPALLITDAEAWHMDLDIASEVQSHERHACTTLAPDTLHTMRADRKLIWIGDGQWLEGEKPEARGESDLEGIAGLVGWNLIRYLGAHPEIGAVIIAKPTDDPQDIIRIRAITATTPGHAAVIGIVRTPDRWHEDAADIAYGRHIPCLTARVTYKGGAAYD